MNLAKVHRLYGLMSGLLFFRAIENLTWSLSCLFKSRGDLGAGLKIAWPGMAMTVVLSVMAAIYIGGRLGRLKHYVMTVMGILTVFASGVIFFVLHRSRVDDIVFSIVGVLIIVVGLMLLDHERD